MDGWIVILVFFFFLSQPNVFSPPGVYTAHCFVMFPTVTGAFTVYVRVCVCVLVVG